VLDADGDIEYATPAVESRMGYTPTDLERTAIDRLVHPDDRAAVRETLAFVTDAPVGTTDRVTPRLGHADGTWQVSELTLTNRLADPTVEGVVVTRTGAGSAADSAIDDGIRAGVDRLADAFFTLGPRDELRYANDAAMSLFIGTDTGIGGELGPRRALRSARATAPTRSEPSSGTSFRTTSSARRSTTAFERPRRRAPLRRSKRPFLHSRGDSPSPFTPVTTVSRSTRGNSPRCRDRGDRRPPRTPRVRRRRARRRDRRPRGDDGSAAANPALLDLADADALVGRELEDVFADDLATTIRERARSPVIRWMDPISGVLETDASPPVDVFVAPLSDPDRTLCVVRDRRGSRGAALSSIRRALVALRRAETPSAVRDATTAAVRELAGADVAVWYRAEDDRFRPATVAAAERIGGDKRSLEPPPIDPDGSPLSDVLENEGAIAQADDDGAADHQETGGLTVYERADLAGLLERAGLRAERVLAVPVANRAVVLATSTEPMAFDGLESDPIDAVSDAATVALESLERADGLRASRHERDRLEAVVERTERVWDAGQSILAADTREAVERRLCEAIVSLDPLESAGEIGLAWVGHADDGRKRVVPSTWVGRDGEFLESTTVPLETDVGARRKPRPRRAPVVLDDLSIDRREQTTEDQSWRRRLLERGFRSAIGVALTAGGVRYGTLTAYANRPSAFDDRTRRACRHLASIAGAVIGAIETKRALLADRITELEVVIGTTPKRYHRSPAASIDHSTCER